MAELKTQPTGASVEAFLNEVPDATRRADGFALLALMTEVTGWQAEMWGASLVGFGRYHYQYADGKPGVFFVTGFSPRKTELTVYSAGGFAEVTDLLAALGKHRVAKSCLHFKSMAKVDQAVLRTLIARVVAALSARRPVDPT